MEVRIGVRDPRDPDAQTCLRAYETELASRFDDGFDPALSISAADEEMTPPAGLFLVADRGRGTRRVRRAEVPRRSPD